MNESKKDEVEFIPVGETVSILLRGKTWWYNAQFNRKQIRRSLKTRSKKEAILKAQRIEADLDRGAAPAKIRASTIFEAVAAFILSAEVEGRAKKTLQKYRYVTKIILEHAQEKRRSNTSQLTHDFADSFRAKLKGKGRQPKTIYCALVILRSLTLFAVRRRMLDVDPLLGYRLRKPKPTIQPCWTPKEADQIIEASGENYHDFFLFLRETGCRAAEGKYLTWGDCDFPRRTIHIRPKDDWKPKTGDQRKIPITDRLFAMLKQRVRKGRWVFTAPARVGVPSENRQVSKRRALLALKKVLNGLGLPGHLHTFRHTYISQALSRGVPEAVVRSWVGHVDDAVIRLYTHISDEVSQAYVTRFSLEGIESRAATEP